MTLEIIVHGIVQGVNYRRATASKAAQLGLVGSVRNLPNGTVTIIAKGMPDQLTSLVDWCKTGPKGAKVTNVECHEIDDKNYQSFEIFR